MDRVFSHRRSGYKVLRIIGMVIGGIIIACLMAFLFGYLVQLLWNWLMPGIFGLGTISYWQGFGLFLLAKFLFGGFKGHDYHSRKTADSSKWTKHRSIRHWSPDKLKKFFRYWDEKGESDFEDYIKQNDGNENKTE
ncbi:MAG: hypothetical protein JW864_10595 [Spirochaetes bacterium]|nr:hypothetical protein [Spirochaetota bacterium]